MAPRSLFQQNIQRISATANAPTQEHLGVCYGKIAEVDTETNQVRPQLWLRGEWQEPLKYFLPLITPLSDVHLQWGSLRPGLTIRLWYTGKEVPDNGLVEIIGNEGDLDFLTKENKANILGTGPYKLITGGLLSL